MKNFSIVSVIVLGLVLISPESLANSANTTSSSDLFLDWEFVDGGSSSRVSDVSGNNNSGVLMVGGLDVGSAVGFYRSVGGPCGSSFMDLSGSEYIQGVRGFSSPNDFTVSLYFKYNTTDNSVGSGKRLVSLWGDLSGDRHFVVEKQAENRTIDVQVDGCGYVDLPMSLADNNWHHLVVSVSAGSSCSSGEKVFVDGSLVSQNLGGTVTPRSGVANFTVGKLPVYSGSLWEGGVAKVKLFSRALSTQEAQDLYNQCEITTSTTTSSTTTTTSTTSTTTASSSTTFSTTTSTTSNPSSTSTTTTVSTTTIDTTTTLPGTALMQVGRGVVVVNNAVNILVNASRTTNILGYSFNLAYDPSKLLVTNIDGGNYLEGCINPFLIKKNNTGSVGVDAVCLGQNLSSSGTTFAAITFRGLSAGNSSLMFTSATITLGDSSNKPVATIDGLVTVTSKSGDANGDDKTDYNDLIILAVSYGKNQGSGGYDSRADFNGDRKVDYQDLLMLASDYGK